MHAYKVDVPVLLIFFARPEIFSKVFEQVKIARPRKLFLYQDGPREDRPDDAEKSANAGILPKTLIGTVKFINSISR